MGKLPFTDADNNNLELVRQVLLRRLKEQSGWNQFNYDDAEQWADYVEFTEPRLRYALLELAREAFWQLISQGIVTPGMNVHNPSLPWFRLTQYGKRVLAEDKFVPHDPTGYLRELRDAASTMVSEVSVAYVTEALRCFNAGCNTAAALLLGVAAEAVVLNLLSVVRTALKDPQKQAEYDRLPDHVRPKHKWLLDQYRGLRPEVRRQKLPESLEFNLGALYDLIRRQRNELGHPQEQPPEVGREHTFLLLKMFPMFVADAEAFARYCSTSGL